MQTLKILVVIIFLFFSSTVFANKDIFVVNHGWHAGIVLETEDINNSAWQIDSLFKKYKYIEVGWGDEAFYKSSDPSVWMTLKAALIPTSSVLHVRALSRYDLSMFSKESVEKITISKKGYTKLLGFIENSFAKKDYKSIILSEGLYPNSFFYLSSKKYHILNTCNVWTAEALQSAEVDISPFFTLTTDDLFSQIREIQNQP
ncbi:MAG: DUF2459 domain-containing protein [Sulfurimonas sp.]|nr:DUF2459 domain-containing protein [Sulfurimonas sp.]